MPSPQMIAQTVACRRCGVGACHQRGDKSRCGAWMGALLASEVCRLAQVCPLLQARGWRACLSPKGELRSHLSWPVHRRAVLPKAGPPTLKPSQAPHRLHPALPSQSEPHDA
jgi:hypothetical protein